MSFILNLFIFWSVFKLKSLSIRALFSFSFLSFSLSLFSLSIFSCLSLSILSFSILSLSFLSLSCFSFLSLSNFSFLSLSCLSLSIFSLSIFCCLSLSNLSLSIFSCFSLSCLSLSFLSLSNFSCLSRSCFSFSFLSLSIFSCLSLSCLSLSSLAFLSLSCLSFSLLSLSSFSCLSRSNLCLSNSCFSFSFLSLSIFSCLSLSNLSFSLLSWANLSFFSLSNCSNLSFSFLSFSNFSLSFSFSILALSLSFCFSTLILSFSFSIISISLSISNLCFSFLSFSFASFSNLSFSLFSISVLYELICFLFLLLKSILSLVSKFLWNVSFLVLILYSSPFILFWYFALYPFFTSLKFSFFSFSFSVWFCCILYLNKSSSFSNFCSKFFTPNLLTCVFFSSKLVIVIGFCCSVSSSLCFLTNLFEILGLSISVPSCFEKSFKNWLLFRWFSSFFLLENLLSEIFCFVKYEFLSVSFLYDWISGICSVTLVILLYLLFLISIFIFFSSLLSLSLSLSSFLFLYFSLSPFPSILYLFSIIAFPLSFIFSCSSNDLYLSDIVDFGLPFSLALNLGLNLISSFSFLIGEPWVLIPFSIFICISSLLCSTFGLLFISLELYPYLFNFSSLSSFIISTSFLVWAELLS